MSKEKNSKKSSAFGLVIILILVCIAAGFILGGKFGFGNGGDGEAVSVGATVSSDVTSDSESETEETATVKQDVVYVNIEENNYIYNNKSLGLDEFADEITKFENDVEVHITVSKTATLDALEKLESKLDDIGIKYVSIYPEDENGETE